MTWWFLILGVSSLAVVWVIVALYVRVRNQMKSSERRRPNASVEGDSDRKL